MVMKIKGRWMPTFLVQPNCSVQMTITLISIYQGKRLQKVKGHSNEIGVAVWLI